MSLPIALSSLLLLALALPGQERQALLGLLKDRAGKPWAAAKVLLRHLPHPDLSLGGGLDEVEVESDAEGRFRARLLRGQRYAAFAYARTGDGGYRHSAYRQDVLPGVPLILAEVGRRPGLELSLQGAEAWAGAGALRLSLFQPGLRPVLRRPLQGLGEGRYRLPEMPEGPRELEVWDGAGRCLLVEPLDHKPKRRPALIRAGAEPGTLHFVLPGPQTIQVKATDLGGKPFGYVQLFGRYGSQRDWQPLGRSMLDGVFELSVPVLPAQLFELNAIDLQVLVLAAGRVEAAHSLSSREIYASDAARREVQRQRRGELQLKLPAGHSLKGRLMLGAAQPAAGSRLLLYAGMRQEGHFERWREPPRVFVCDAEGRFLIHGRNPKYASRLVLLLDRELRRRLDTDPQYPLAPQVHLFAGFVGADRDLGELRLDRARRSRLQVQEPRGAAAVGAEVLAFEPVLRKAGTAVPAPMLSALRMRCDHLGRLGFLHLGQVPLQLLVCGRDGAQRRAVAADEKVQRFRLDASRMLRLQLKDADGDLGAGVAVQAYVDPRARPDELIEAAMPPGVREQLLRWGRYGVIPGMHGVCDGEGRIRIPWFHRDYGLRLYLEGGGVVPPARAPLLWLPRPGERGAEQLEVHIQRPRQLP